ncbi:MAG: Spy/CpxP family protein refolding chaperone, partial [Blastocatellia bacterium]
MKMTKPQTRRRKLRVRISALTATLLSAVCVMVLCANSVSSQGLRRQMRIQKKIDKKLNRPAGNQNRPAGNPNRPSPSNNNGKDDPLTSNQLETTESRNAARQAAAQQSGHSLEGIRQRGIRSLFTQEEERLLIQGFGNSAAALLVIFRQLDLTPEQKIKIRDIRRQMGNRLPLTRRELNQLEAQLDEAIYGNLDPASLDSYDPAKVKELTEQVVQKRSELFRLLTDIESQFRQILTPDQFFVFRGLLREMVRPGSRPLVNPALRQQQKQRRMGTQPNPRNKP